MRRNVKLIIALIILIILMFLGASDRISYIISNAKILYSNSIPEDINIQAVKNNIENYTGYDTFIYGIGKGLVPFSIIICPLILGYMFAGDFAYNLKTGFGNFIITRQKFRNYFIKITFKTFVKAFLLVLISEIIFLIICLIIFGNEKPIELYSPVVDSLGSIYYKIPFLYCLLQSLIQSFYMAILTIIGMGFTMFTSNKFIITLSPFVIYLMINIICPILDMAFNASILQTIYPDYLIMSFMTGTYFMDNPIIHNVIGFGIYIIIASALLLCMYKKYNENYLR